MQRLQGSSCRQTGCGGHTPESNRLDTLPARPMLRETDMATYTHRQQLKIWTSYNSARKETIEAVVAALWGRRVSKGLQSCRSELTLFAADFEATWLAGEASGKRTCKQPPLYEWSVCSPYTCTRLSCRASYLHRCHTSSHSERRSG